MMNRSIALILLLEFLTAKGRMTETVQRKDYRAPEYTIEAVDLDVRLDPEETIVRNAMLVCMTSANVKSPLVFNGEDIELISIEVGGRKLSESEYTYKDHLLTIPQSSLPQLKAMRPFEVTICNKNFPTKNTELAGLYTSAKLLCTQCESQGFRRFTFFIDRPDVMAAYKVRLEATEKDYPVLLCNGDEVRTEKNLPDGRHAAVFVDPFKKPCYLFAIVAGPLKSKSTTFTTMPLPEQPSREVDVYVYSEEKYIDSMDWALECTVKAMKWDEDVYGRVYDLSTFRVVCVEDFNAGAMENKSLTTFNVSAVVASKDTTTDVRFKRVATVIGHEYFHNWSGDRVTVRDWFQITLKEGFTTVREQGFGMFMFSPSVLRIDDVLTLRVHQFKEDAGPMAHPIRPESYQSIDNFYTATVYEKGSEVIRQLETLFGPEGYRRGCDLYFDRNDGKAVECDDFVRAFGDANNVDLSQFMRWYRQKGTPRLEVLESAYDSAKKTFTLKLRQHVPAQDAGVDDVGPYHFPVVVGLIGLSSKADLLTQSKHSLSVCDCAKSGCSCEKQEYDVRDSSVVVQMKEETQTFTFHGIAENCIASILRDFSAPVILEQHLTDEQLSFLMCHDSNPFNSWDAQQTILSKVILDRADKVVKGEDIRSIQLPACVVEAMHEALKDRQNDLEFVAQCLTLPPTSALEQKMKPFADPPAIAEARVVISEQIFAAMKQEFTTLFNKLWKESQSTEWAVNKKDVARRSLQSSLLSWIAYDTEDKEQVAKIVREFFDRANCFNDKVAAFNVSCNITGCEDVIEKFYEMTKHDDNQLNVWFTAQALSRRVDALERVKNLTQHPDFMGRQNNNRFRALVRAFGENPRAFHDISGAGYKLVAEQVVKYDALNSYTASNCAKTLILFQNYSPDRQKLMKEQLNWMATQSLSVTTKEVVTSALKN